MKRLNQHWHGIPPAPGEKSQKLSWPERALHEQFVYYGQNAKEWILKCVLLLPRIDRLRIWEKRGFSSIYEYAAKLAGMSRGKVEEGLRVMRKTEGLPALRKVVEEKGIWAVIPVLTIANKENEAILAQHSKNMSVSTLKSFVREFKKSHLKSLDVQNAEKPLLTMGDDLTDRGKLELLLISVDKEVARKLQRIKGNGDWNFLMRLLIHIWEEQLFLEKPKSLKTKSRHIPNTIRRYLMKRSSCYCEFPECMRHYAELHHADRFQLVWKHDPDRIFALCKEHHELAHHGLIANEDSDVKFWRVQQRANVTDIKYVIDQAVMLHRKKANKKSEPP